MTTSNENDCVRLSKSKFLWLQQQFRKTIWVNHLSTPTYFEIHSHLFDANIRSKYSQPKVGLPTFRNALNTWQVHWCDIRVHFFFSSCHFLLYTYMKQETWFKFSIWLFVALLLSEMFTLWSLIEASMLCLNAVCILHEERFLAKGINNAVGFGKFMQYLFHLFRTFSVGWGANSAMQSFGEPTTKAQLLNLIRSIRTVAKSMESLNCSYILYRKLSSKFFNLFQFHSFFSISLQLCSSYCSDRLLFSTIFLQ